MPSAITQKKDTETTIKVSLTQDQLEPVLKQVVSRLRPRVNAAGFRPGKAPDSIVEREVGSNALQREVLEAATMSSYSRAIQELGIKAVSNPEVSITKFVPYTELEYEAKVEVLPEIAPPQYKKLRLKRPEAEVEPAEVGAVIEDLRYRQAKKTVKAGSAELGDELTLDFTGSHEGQAVASATAKNYTARLGSGRLLPGFEEKLIGTKSDQEINFELTLPADYPETEVAGKTLNFKVKVNSIWQVELPELNSEFLTGIGPFKNEADLRKDLEQKLKVQKEDEISYRFERQVLDELLKQSQFSVPGGLIHQQQHKLLDELKLQIENRGLGFDEYLKLTGKTEEAIENELHGEAERRVRLAILLSEIAKAEQLTLASSELDNEIKRLKESYADPKLQQELSGEAGRESVYNHLMAQKVINKILEYVEGTK